MNSKLSEKRLHFETLADIWDDRQPANRVLKISSILSIFDQSFVKVKKILEVGTGTGTLIPVLRARYPSAMVTSMDLAHKMLISAKKRPGSYLVQGDIHHLPLMQNSYDAVIIHNAFPHFDDQAQTIKEIKRVLNPFGDLLIFHDISRERVNQVHQNSPSPIIQQDILPKVRDLTASLVHYDFQSIKAEDNEKHYFIYAKLNGLIA